MALLHRFTTRLLVAVAVGLVGTVAIAQVPSQSRSTVSGITVPSRKLKLSFAAPGLVTETLVKEGDKVTKDQLLATQDDRMDKKQLEGILIEANSPLQADAARADWEQKKVELERKLKIFNEPGIRGMNDSEVEEARLAVKIGEIRIRLAEQENSTKKIEGDRQEIRIGLMQLKSPIEGVVKKLNIGIGEMADPQNRDGAIVIVKNDPLWVEMFIPREQAARLEIGTPMEVQYPSEASWSTAKVIYRDPEADAASGMQLVRMEMANPDDHDAGSQVIIKLPEKIAAIGAEAQPNARANP